MEKETLAQVLPCEFCEISKNTFFTEHIWITASVAGIHTDKIMFFMDTVINSTQNAYIYRHSQSTYV